MFWLFCHEACGTRDQTCIGCIRRWSLNHWTNREVKLRLYYGFSQFCFNIHRYQISWGFIGIFRADTLLLKHVSEGDSEHVTYLLLHNKLPQGFSALKQQSILISHHPEGCLAVSSVSCVHGQGARRMAGIQDAAGAGPVGAGFLIGLPPTSLAGSQEGSLQKVEAKAVALLRPRFWRDWESPLSILLVKTGHKTTSDQRLVVGRAGGRLHFLMWEMTLKEQMGWDVWLQLSWETDCYRRMEFLAGHRWWLLHASQAGVIRRMRIVC